MINLFYGWKCLIHEIEIITVRKQEWRTKMKTIQTLFMALLVFSVMAVLAPSTQAQTCDSTNTNFVDLDGDGFNDNAPDHDGDGIPNGQDPDYIKQAKDGTGQQKGKLNRTGTGDGTGDGTMNKFQKKNRFGNANSTKFQSRANRGSGSQAAGTGTGVCDGTGPQGGSAVCDGSGPKGPRGRGGN